MTLFDRFNADMDEVFLTDDFAEPVTLSGGGESGTWSAITFNVNQGHQLSFTGEQSGRSSQFVGSRADAIDILGRLPQLGDNVAYGGVTYIVQNVTLDPAAVALTCNIESPINRLGDPPPGGISL